MIPVAKQEFCAHGFSFGYCPDNCIKLYYHQDVVREKRRAFLKLFKPRDWKNPITKQTLILKLQQFQREEQYVQFPINMVTIGNVKLYQRNEPKHGS